VKDLVRFELSGVPCAIRLSEVARILPASAEDLDLADALGLPSLGPLGARERSLSLGPGQPSFRIGHALTFAEGLKAAALPDLARGHPWVAGVLLSEDEAPVLELHLNGLEASA
jgi:hypothetical protein